MLSVAPAIAELARLVPCYLCAVQKRRRHCVSVPATPKSLSRSVPTTAAATGDGRRYTEHLHACACRAHAPSTRMAYSLCPCCKITQHGLTTEGGSLGAGERRFSVLTQGVHQVHVPLPSVLPHGTHAHASTHAIHVSGAYAGILANTLVWYQSLADVRSMPHTNYLRTPHSSGRARRTVARPFATSIQGATPISKSLHMLAPRSPSRWGPWASAVHPGCILRLSGQGCQALRLCRQISQVRR